MEEDLKIKSDFMPIEEPIHKLKPSRIAFLKNYMLSALLASFVAYLFLTGFPLVGPVWMTSFLLILIFLALPEIERLRNTYVVTSSQVITEEGIVSRKRRSIFFNNVDVSVHQNFFGRLLRYGTVSIGSSTGRDYMELRLRKVQRPKELAYSIERLIRDYSNIRTRHENAEKGKDEKKESE